MRVFVLAETPELFADWCARQRVNPAAAEHVRDPHSLRGRLRREDRVFDAREKPEAREAMYAH